MSGFLPDLASWALRGSRDNANNNAPDDSGDDAGASSSSAPTNANDPPPLTAEQMRAQRLARMEELQRREALAAQQQQGVTDKNNMDGPRPMDVDDDVKNDSPTVAAVANSPSPSAVKQDRAPSEKKHKVTGTGTGTADAAASQRPSPPPSTPLSAAEIQAKKVQRKKELLLRKILHLTLKGGLVADAGGVSSSSSSSLEPSPQSVVQLDLGDQGTDASIDLSPHAVAEILATRLSLEPSQLPVSASSASLMTYLSLSYRRAVEERKMLLQSNTAEGPKAAENEALVALVEEINKQVVSYGVSCLREPDLFAQSADAVTQLANLILNASIDPTTSVFVGTAGPNSSYYHKLVEEFVAQGAVDELNSVVGQLVELLMAIMLKIETVLDSTVPDPATGITMSVSSVAAVSALQGLCSHKRVALMVVAHPKFLLPPPNSPTATELIRPALPRTGGTLMQLMMGGAMGEQFQPYQKRSGPALDKQTVLGSAMRIGLPRTNAAFSPTSILHQSQDSVERTMASHRLQLRNHQQSVYNFIMNLLKGGTEARDVVQKWFLDCLLVNRQADGMRPDVTKVSSRQLLMNVSAVLLKLCDPFVDDESKLALVDPGFVMAEAEHLGVFELSGDDAVPRLGESVDAQGSNAAASSYKPKNRFVPFCFFATARSLRYSLHASLDLYENVSRQLSWRHSNLSAAGRDIRNDPEFAHIFSVQKSLETSALEPEFVAAACRFENYCARVLGSYDDAALKTMPEDMVDDICEILVSIATFKPRLLLGLDFRYVFQLMVKLLSPTYASMVRNYNLRAKIGDVLFELFLPPTASDRRETPESVYTDPLAGGETFLLSDPSAQETLAPSLLLLYGEVEHTGFYDKMSHRSKIASLIKYLWESSQHRVAFRRITSDRTSFIKFANGIMNETNTLIATVMQKLPEIREAQERMKDAEGWGRLTEEQQKEIEDRLSDSQREVKYALPLCNRTIQMLSYLNTDADIRSLFLLKELCPRLVQMLLSVLSRLVGSKGLNLKVDNPDQYEFRPKEMLRDLCAVFSLFASSDVFAEECARSQIDPNLLRTAIKTCKRLNLLVEGEAMRSFESLPERVEAAFVLVRRDEELYKDAPDEFLDELMATFMHEPVKLPSGHYVDKSTITQHLLNDPTDPFSRAPLSVEDVEPATELQARMAQWVEAKRQSMMDQS